MIERILLPLDGSELAECVLPHAVALSQAFGARLYLLRIEGGKPAESGTVAWRLRKAEAEAYLEELSVRLTASGVRRVEWRVEEGRAAEQVLQRARREKADLVLLSTHGRGGITGFGLSGTASKVVFDGRVSVLLVRAAKPPARQPLRYRKILVPIDCSKRAEWAACTAAGLAKEHGAELVLVHVVPLAEVLEPLAAESEAHGISRRLTELNRQAALLYLRGLVETLRQPDLRVRSRLAQQSGEHVGCVVQAIVSEESPDLIVMAAHGADPTVGWAYGSVTRELLALGDVPLLVLQDAPAPAAGREEPAAAAVRTATRT